MNFSFTTFTSHKRLMTLISVVTLTTILSACGVVDSIEDAVNADPQRSTCQAYCEWATACHSQSRTLDEEATLTACLESTRAANDDCTTLETEGVNRASAELYQSCTEAIDAERAMMNCDPFTGNAVAVNTSLPPAACVAVIGSDSEVFNAARIATAESNDELCERMSRTLCNRSTQCFTDEYNISQNILDELTPPADEQCLTQFEESVTSACRNDGLYSISSDNREKLQEISENVAFNINASREAARACLNSLEEIACGELFSGELPPVCVGAFSDPATTANVLSNFACGLDQPELEPICGG